MAIDTDRPPTRRLERLESWLRGRPSRQWLILLPLVMLLTAFVLLAWIAVAFALGSTERDAGAVALNAVLVGFVATIGLLSIHSALYRWYWHLDRRRRSGTLRAGDPEPAYGSEPTAPAPAIAWPSAYRLRHGLARLSGMAALLYVFLPHRNQVAIAHFLAAHSAERASAGSLAALIFFYLPFGLIMAAIMLLTHRQLRRRDAGLLSAREALLLEAEINWLFSFAAALLVTVFLCHFAGTMIVAWL